MKKHFIIPMTLLAIFVSSCTASKPKKKKSSSEEFSTCYSEVSKTSETSSFSTSSIVQSSSLSSSKTSESPIPDEYTKIFLLEGTEFAADLGYPSAGVKFDDESTPTKVEELKNYFSSNLISEELVTSLSCKNVNLTKTDVPHLVLGSGSDFTSKFTFLSSTKMYKVVIQTTMYYKYDSYHDITNYDSQAKVIFDNQTTLLEYNEAEKKGIQKEFTLESKEGITEFTIESQDGRVLLNSIQITWRA